MTGEVDVISNRIYRASMNAVRRLRQQAGMTQAKLASLAGTSQPTIAAYETGSKSPTLDTVGRIANSLGLEASIEYVPRLTREDRRSLEYHRAVVAKLRRSPSLVVAKARENLARFRAKHPDARRLFERWGQWLELPVEDLVLLCLDPGPSARDMRQVTPFAGILSAGDRLEILEKFRKQEGVR
jgi:transcriptional regulator with XRE-family HTH domain